MNEVHIYPVGVLRQLIELRAALNPLARQGYGRPPKSIWQPGWRRTAANYAIRTILFDSRRRSAWNGYLAEPASDDLHWTHCGHGWTKRRAVTSLNRHLAEVQP